MYIVNETICYLRLFPHATGLSLPGCYYERSFSLLPKVARRRPNSR